ncbi:hypothetical protein IIM_04802 [Bacillus cereus VD107]|nr:hypothetical protein IIM_04802 [Bacillus cereus VD107]
MCKKKTLKKITINQEHLHQILLNIDDKELEYYKIQQYISWATIENQCFDIKVTLHRRKNRFKWKITEKFAETLNKTLTIEQAIKYSNLKNIDIKQLLIDIDNIALKIAQQSNILFLKNRIFDINIRLDQNGKIKILGIYSNRVKVKRNKLKGNKLKMYDFFKNDHYLSRFIPETKEINDENTLFSFLNMYRHVILKPISGSLGRGIMKLVINNDNQYTLQYANKTFQFINQSQLLTFLKQKMKSKPYIIQQCIQLAKVKDSPFDFRVIVQQESNNCIWKVNGVYAKVAFDGYFTTNLAKKGKAITINQAMSNSNLKEKNLKEILKTINIIALRVAQKLKKISPDHRIWGLDMGIDSNGKLWIIEVNSKPGIVGFKRLEDQSMYHTIREYKKLNVNSLILEREE